MRGTFTITVAALSCGAFVAAAEPFTIAMLRRAAALDVPGARSSHRVATPRGGGAPIAAGLVTVGLLVHSGAAIAFAVAVAGYAAIGLADDLAGSQGGLPARRRLALQAAVATVVTAALARQAGWPALPAAAAAAAGALWLTGFVNAFNFMDGVNGISAAHAAIGGCVYAGLGLWRRDGFVVAAGAAAAAGALAFLPWNAWRARVFLGDVGSYGLGAALAVLAIRLVADQVPPEAALGPMLLYVADTGWTLQRRIRAGEPWLEAHRTHVYQRWCDIGWSHQRVTATAAAVTTLLCALGMASLTGSLALRAAADAAAAGLVALYLRSPALLARPAGRARRLERLERA